MVVSQSRVLLLQSIPFQSNTSLLSFLANYLEIFVSDAKTYEEGRARYTDYQVREGTILLQRMSARSLVKGTEARDILGLRF